MPILKQTQTAGAMKDAVVLDLGDLGRQAARLRMQAEAQAANIITDAEKKAAQLVENASGQGFEQGRAEGLEQGMNEGLEQGRAQALAEAAEQLQQVQTAWSDVAEQWDAHRTQMDREARQSVIEFALKLAERVVHRVIEVDETVIADQLANALALVLRPMDVAVRINPADRPVLTEAMPQLMNEFARFEHIELIDDDTITRGGCSVSYGQGEIDATLDTQLQRVVELILPEESEDVAADGEPMIESSDNDV